MKLRSTNVERLGREPFDVLIVGGGINGAVSAASLSARGIRVALVDREDFAGVTSQQSSNLAWGGIKYLETFELGLVRKLCMARNHLIAAYPSTVQPIAFYLTHERGFRRSRLLLWLGAWLYWLIGDGFLRPPRLLGRAQIEREEPIVDMSHADGGLEYQDAYLHDNDARFVWNFVRGAINHGCVAANYVEVTAATRDASGMWQVSARDSMSGGTLTVRAKVLLNACGPYVDAFNATLGVKTEHRHVLSKGVHLIVRKLTTSRRVLTFFADDGRLFFVIPMGTRTCIGTTDLRVDDPHVQVTAEDREFILSNIGRRLRLDAPLTTSDIIAERCGVRPLAVSGEGSHGKDWTQLSRKHAIEVGPASISIFGGKLTDCLNVGEEIYAEVTRIGVVAPYPESRWYGEPPAEVKEEYFHQARLMNLDEMTSPRSSEPLSTRLWRRYGSEALGLLEAIRQDPLQAELLIENAEYVRCEIEQAASREMITRLDDFLRRRSKIALVVSHEALRGARGLREACDILFGAEAEAKLTEYFDEISPSPAS